MSIHAPSPRTGTIHKILEIALARHTALALVGLVAVALVIETSSASRVTHYTVIGYMGIAAAGLTLLTGLSGQLSLGHGAFMAIGAWTAALFNQEVVHNPLSTITVAVLATIPAGALVAVAAARLSGPYLAGATLALALAVPGLAFYFRDTLGGEQGLSVRLPDVPVWFADAIYFLFAHDVDTTKYVAYLAWFTLIVTLVFLANLKRSQVGRTWKAVRGDPVAAELAGINLERSRIAAFVVSAACAGAAGAVLALAVRITAPSGFGIPLSLLLVSAIVLGGLGSLTGAVIGTAILTLLPHYTTDLGRSAGLDDLRAAELGPLAHGTILVLVILLAPAGIAGLAHTFRTHLSDRLATKGRRTAQHPMEEL
jgi:branched-chain amino acid transport system permease protein